MWCWHLAKLWYTNSVKILPFTLYWHWQYVYLLISLKLYWQWQYVYSGLTQICPRFLFICMCLCVFKFYVILFSCKFIYLPYSQITDTVSSIHHIVFLQSHHYLFALSSLFSAWETLSCLSGLNFIISKMIYKCMKWQSNSSKMMPGETI